MQKKCGLPCTVCAQVKTGLFVSGVKPNLSMAAKTIPDMLSVKQDVDCPDWTNYILIYTHYIVVYTIYTYIRVYTCCNEPQVPFDAWGLTYSLHPPRTVHFTCTS